MPKVKKIYFENKEGEKLAARIEFPINQSPVAFALFAHCFTCNKNLGAVRNVSKALTKNGIAVMRFDFTGLGESEGDFADTNFSSNVEDLIAAAEYLKLNYGPPSLLVGHSLGGAAVIFASARLEDVKAVATIGAPSEPEHVAHLLEHNVDAIKKKGVSVVSIGGRPFNVKNQFLEDIKTQKLGPLLSELRKAILVMHSPQDTVVDINNAQKLYVAAHHPKSFISLNGADHLLSNKEDSLYVGETIASWSKRYLNIPSRPKVRTNSQVATKLLNGDIFTTVVQTSKHTLIADEPESIGGNDYGPTPHQYVSGGLGACTAMTLQMYARRKKWDLKKVIVHLDYERIISEEKDAIHLFTRKLELEGQLDATQRNRLMEIANKCPVHKTLEGEVRIQTKLI